MFFICFQQCLLFVCRFIIYMYTVAKQLLSSSNYYRFRLFATRLSLFLGVRRIFPRTFRSLIQPDDECVLAIERACARARTHECHAGKWNPLCQLIDQITSRWNTLPNSNHHTHRLPSQERGIFIRAVSPSSLLPSRFTSTSCHPSPRHGSHRDIEAAKLWERHFLFHLCQEI